MHFAPIFICISIIGIASLEPRDYHVVFITHNKSGSFLAAAFLYLAFALSFLIFSGRDALVLHKEFIKVALA